MKLSNLFANSAVLLALSAALVADDTPAPIFASTSGIDCDANGLIDVDEIQFDKAKDANFNGVLDRCEGLRVDKLEISVSQGGTQTMTAELGPAFGAYIYWILGTTAGTSPGITLGYQPVPLNFDGPASYMTKTTKHPNQGELANTLGFFDPAGMGVATFTLPPASDPALAGTVLHHAYVVMKDFSGNPFWASNAVSLRLVP